MANFGIGTLECMFTFEESLRQISGQTVLCVGDLMLDNFVYGEVSRVSPEAPAPVIAVTREEKLIGAPAMSPATSRASARVASSSACVGMTNWESCYEPASKSSRPASKRI